MSQSTELIRSLQTPAAAPGSARVGGRAPSSAICGGCLAASAMLIAGRLSGQEALRGFAAANTSSSPLLQPENMPYTYKTGDFRLLVTPALALDWNDNIRLSNENPQDDFIVRPTMGLNMSYPITQRNLLQLNVNFGYTKYITHDDLSTWYVQSGSALSFDVFVKDIKINLHDQFSYMQDSAQEAAVANTGSYGTLNNSIGTLVSWDIKDITPSLGYDHQIVQSTTPQFNMQDHTTESFVGRMGYKLHPTVTAGFEGTAAFTSYDQPGLNKNAAYSAGVYSDWQPGTYFHVQARGGYSIFQFQQTSQTIQSSDLNSWYAGLTATHQISEGVNYTLSAGHDVRLGIQSDAIEEWYATPAINWSIIRKWTFQTSLSYQHGNQGVADRTGGSSEIYDWYVVGLGLNHPITDRLNASLNYRLTLRSSNEPANDYTQNFVELLLAYQFR